MIQFRLSLHATKSQRSRGHHKFASGSNLLQHGAQSAPRGPELPDVALVRASWDDTSYCAPNKSGLVG